MNTSTDTNNIFPKKKLLIWGHSSGQAGGGDKDLTDLLFYLSNKKSFNILGAFPVGPRNKTNSRMCTTSNFHRGALFPISYESLLDYFLYLLFAIKQIKQTHKFIKENAPDGILFFSSALLLPFLWSWNYKVKRYLFVRELLTPFWVRNLIYRRIYNRADLIFVVSNFLQKELQYLKLNPPIYTIFSLPEVNINSTHVHNNSKFRIACVGAISKIKGQLKLVQASHKLKCSENIELHFFGEVPTYSTGIKYFNKIKNFQAKHNLKTRLVFHGSMEHKKLLVELKSFNLIAIPSESEGLCIVLLEAILLKVPVIASRIGEIQNIIKHEHNGLLFEPDDISGIAKCIVIMQRDKSLYKKIKDNLGILPSYLGNRSDNYQIILTHIENNLSNDSQSLQGE